MSKEDDLILDGEFLDSVADNFVAAPADKDQVSRLRARIMRNIDDKHGKPGLFDTIRSNEGEWIEILPNVEKKLLKVDSQTGTESYLLRMQPGATAPAHVHETDELCYVIEGDLSFGDIHLNAGDYHFAHRGSRHESVSTVGGTLLFLQSGVEF